MPLYIASVDVLVEAPSDARVFEALDAALNIGAPTDSVAPVVIHDMAHRDMREAHPTVEDSIVNETYQAGDAFADWVWFSASSRTTSNAPDGYYSREYGWKSTVDLATRYDGGASPPENHPSDATLVLLQRG